MCVGRPARVLRVKGLEASVDTWDGHTMRAILATPQPIQSGDYVLLLGDTAVSKMDRGSVLEDLETMKGLALSAADEDGDEVRAVESLYEERAQRLTRPLRGRE